MTEDIAHTPTETRSAEPRRGRDARRSARSARSGLSIPYISRALAPVNILSEESLAIIEHNAETLLEQVGL